MCLSPSLNLVLIQFFLSSYLNLYLNIIIILSNRSSSSTSNCLITNEQQHTDDRQSDRKTPKSSTQIGHVGTQKMQGGKMAQEQKIIRKERGQTVLAFCWRGEEEKRHQWRQQQPLSMMKINGARGGGGGGSTIVSAADEIDGKEVPIASGETKEKERAQHSVVCMSFPLSLS